MTEPTYACPKCGLPFPMSQLHAHFQTCQGKPSSYPQFPVTYPPANISQQLYNPPQQMQAPPQLYIPPPKPEHKHRWSENDTYKVCIDYLYNPTETCREIKVKLRGSWQIFVRYGLKLFVIELIIAFAVAFSVGSYLGIHR